MIIYNVTVNVEKSIVEEWLLWMKNTHIAEVMQTNMFEKYTLLKLLNEEYTEHPTFAIQYFAKSQENINQYLKEFAPALRQKTEVKYGNKVMAFRTFLEIIAGF